MAVSVSDSEDDLVEVPVDRPEHLLETPVEGRSCIVCLEPWNLHGEHAYHQLSCGHVFGIECIQHWLGTRNTCPTCKSPVSSDGRSFPCGDAIPAELSDLSLAQQTEQADKAWAVLEERRKARNRHLRRLRMVNVLRKMATCPAPVWKSVLHWRTSQPVLTCAASPSDIAVAIGDLLSIRSMETLQQSASFAQPHLLDIVASPHDIGRWMVVRQDGDVGTIDTRESRHNSITPYDGAPRPRRCCFHQRRVYTVFVGDQNGGVHVVDTRKRDKFISFNGSRNHAVQSMVHLWNPTGGFRGVLTGGRAGVYAFTTDDVSVKGQTRLFSPHQGQHVACSYRGSPVIITGDNKLMWCSGMNPAVTESTVPTTLPSFGLESSSFPVDGWMDLFDVHRCQPGRKRSRGIELESSLGPTLGVGMVRSDVRERGVEEVARLSVWSQGPWLQAQTPSEQFTKEYESDVVRMLPVATRISHGAPLRWGCVVATEYGVEVFTY